MAKADTLKQEANKTCADLCNLLATENMKSAKHRPDFLLLIVILLLVSIGLLTIYSASIIWAAQFKKLSADYYFIRQFMWTILGLTAMFGVMNVPFWRWRQLLPLQLPFSILLLLVVFAFPGGEDGSYHRWILLGPVSFQPSELATLTVILYMAHIMTKKQDRLDSFKKSVVPPLVITGLFAGLVIAEPDMDAAALIVVTAMAVMFGAGIPIRHFVKLAVPVIGLAALFIFSSEYRRERIFGYLHLDPFSIESIRGEGWQQANSLYAIASGGWTGRGLGRSIQKFLYLPEPHTDFIFSIFAEEWGTIGAIVLIVLFAILIWRSIRIASLLPDRFGSLVAVGITAMIGFAVIANIGMVIGALPVMGIPLPFISYGGSALLIKLLAMGILLNLSRYTAEEQAR